MTTNLTETQFPRAHALARAHGHLWADHVTAADLGPDGISPEEIRRLVDERDSISSDGLAAPEVDDLRRVVHVTATGRARWWVYPSGRVEIQITRPDGTARARRAELEPARREARADAEAALLPGACAEPGPGRYEEPPLAAGRTARLGEAAEVRAAWLALYELRSGWYELPPSALVVDARDRLALAWDALRAAGARDAAALEAQLPPEGGSVLVLRVVVEPAGAVQVETWTAAGVYARHVEAAEDCLRALGADLSCLDGARRLCQDAAESAAAWVDAAEALASPDRGVDPRLAAAEAAAARRQAETWTRAAAG